MKADLHLHSTASDGTLEPGELVALAAELGFTHLALTDHDSVDGLARAMDALALGMTPDAVLTDVEDAMAALGELTGRSVSSDVTARIFERFCVGK